MTEIGFDAAAVGVMAAAYSALIPLLEVPSGILADRRSRRGVLILSSLAIAAGALLGGLSHSVGAYVGSALAFGVYVAFSSGTLCTVHGVYAAGWLLVAATALAGGLLVVTARVAAPVGALALAA